MSQTLTPIGHLDLGKKTKNQIVPAPSEPIFGGYSNGRGEISLFGESLVYRVNFKNKTVQQRPRLNPGAQARYDATQAGEAFEYGNASFVRLSHDAIAEICASGLFRITPKFI